MSDPNQTDSSDQQSMPQITTFQFSQDSVGQIKDSVNLYTGTANIPINIISLPGRQGLDVNVGLMYNSNIQSAVQNWNLTNPTGTVGLGWNMDIEQIVVQKAGSGTPLSDQYYLLSNGSGNGLVQDGFIPNIPQNILTFQTRNYEFWEIRYDPSAEKWTVIKEDGSVFVYGDKHSGRQTVQYGVSWGNWLGSSSTVIGQEQYVTSWNLSEIQNTWGERVVYEYDNVQVRVGDSNGLEYTQASYLKKIIDSMGRTIIFQYGEKYGAGNRSPQNILEYQAAHTKRLPPNAYQDLYETRYLSAIDVLNPSEQLLFTILFEYDFINMGSQSQPTVYPLMYKRVLTSFWQVQPRGKTLPGMEFEYYDGYTDVSPGALKAITYPQGARAVYTYKQQPLVSSRNLKIANPMPGATPRVWFGSDYTVITWYNATTKTLRGTVYAWCGNWLTFDLNSDVQQNYFNNVDLDINSLGVITRSDFIALYFVERTSRQLQLFLYRRNQQKFGVFNLSSGPRYLPVNSTTPNVKVDAGDSFVIAYGKDFTTNPITAYQWNWKQNRWDTTPAGSPPPGSITVLLPSPSDVANATNMTISARNNYYIAALYNKNSKLLQLQLFYHDGNYSWGKSPVYNTPNVQIYFDPKSPASFLFSLGLSDAFATATYINSLSSTAVQYNIRILQWDKSFNLLNPAIPLVNTYTSPINNDKSQFNIFSTLQTDALITNNPYLNRYTGGPGNSNNPQNWKQTVFVTGPSDNVSFATGEDISVLSTQKGPGATNQYLQFDPNFSSWGTVQPIPSTGASPTLSGNYMTVGQDIFYQNTDGLWTKQLSLGASVAPQTMQNHGSAYMAYQDNVSDKANTYFVGTRNGIPGSPVLLPLTAGGTGQKIYVEQDQPKAGTLLSAADTFVTYPADQSWDTAGALALYKVVNGNATDTVITTPVAYVEIVDKLTPEATYLQSYDYASSPQSVITFDGPSSLAQFPKVTVASGTKSPDFSPWGKTISYFSNGVSPQAQIQYPYNWVYNYNLLLNGNLLQKTQYNNQGQLVTQETFYWQIFTGDLLKQSSLYGAYYRLTKNVVYQDGVTQTTELQYFQDIGQQQSSITSYYDASGNFRTIVEESTYAIQIPVYAQAMAQKHLFNAFAQETSYALDKANVRTYISSKVVTWNNWSQDGSWKWAALQNYEWLGPADGKPVFDFSANGTRTGWLKKQEIVSRGLPSDVITEMLNVDGVPSSYLYDNLARFQVAEFPTASLSGDEVSYYGFESYEHTGGWQLGPNARIIPDSTDPIIDAQIGKSSLLINKGTGIQRLFNPKNQKQDYIFSSYVKLPEGFDIRQGIAKWIISFSKDGVATGEQLVLPFGTTVGAWVYIFGIIHLNKLNPAGTDTLIAIDIQAQNDNPHSPVLIDAIRFSPLPSLFAAVAMDTRIGQVNVSLGANGEIRRKFFDDYYRVAGSTGYIDNTSSIATSYFSRIGNNNQFSPIDPNSQTKVISAGGGPALSFTKGSEWERYWSPGAGSVWSTVDGRLTLKSFQSVGELTYKDGMQNQYGVFTNVFPADQLSNPLGIRIGRQLTVQWLPSAGYWQLLDTSGTELQQKTLFQLRTENIPVAGAAGFNTSNLPSLIGGMGNQWLLLVNETSLLFYADGQLVFNYVHSTVITGTATVFAGDSIILDYLLTFFVNQATCTFINETGNGVQSHLLSDNYSNVVQKIYDNQGHVIANTKPAYVTSRQNPIFTYFAGFGTYHPADGSISGFVSTYYPEDGGYPYFGSKYEASPLDRVIEQSMPGTDYRMGANTQKISYGTNDGALGLPAEQYYQTTIIDQNGNRSYTLKDKREQEVRKVSQRSTTEQIIGATYYDDAGNAIELHSPNYKIADTDNENWVTFLTYNFSGQLTGTSSHTVGQVQMIYDPADRLRFRQDAQAAADGNYQYYKYDTAGRIVEKGYLQDTWDRVQLQHMADTDPAYPPTPKTWSAKLFYDNDGTDAPNQVGRVVKALSSQSGSGIPDVEETFQYDASGNVVRRTQKAIAFDEHTYVTGFGYNNLSGITRIDYPGPEAAAPFSLFYQYNTAGQITGLGSRADQPRDIASYGYNAVGKPEQETFSSGGGGLIQRTYRYEPPTWLREIEDTGQSVGQIFNERLKTTADGGAPAYYNGQPAEISYRYPQGIPAGSAYTNWYNGINALVQADETTTSGNKLSRKYTFDDNGNFDSVTVGADSYSYIKATGKGDQLASVQAGGQTKLGFDYDLNGSVKAYREMAVNNTPGHDLGFTYDPANRMTTMIRDGQSGTIAFTYGLGGARVLKRRLVDSIVASSTMYVNSLAGNSLLRISRSGGVSATTMIIYGPTGIVAFIKDSVWYSVLKDHLGSVRVIIDTRGEVAAAYDYDVYGNVQVLKEPSPGFFPYLYGSQEWEEDLGIYNFKARFYFSRAGRFGVVDGYNQFYSPYLYAGNSPMVYIDPSGNFSIGNFFSAIAGAIVGAVEILIGAVVDAISGVLEVLTGGLSTPASVGLAMVGGAFIGAGVSAVSYSAVGLITNDFSWKEYGINTAIGFVAGAITAGFGAAGSIAAEAATGVQAAAEEGVAVSTLSKVANAGIKAGFAIAGAEAAATTSTLIQNAASGNDLSAGLGASLITGALSASLSSAIPEVEYKAGWGNLLKRMVAGAVKSEAIGLTIKLGSNAIQGESLDADVLNTVIEGLVEGSVGGFGTKDFASEQAKDAFNFLPKSGSVPRGTVSADGIIRL